MKNKISRGRGGTQRDRGRERQKSDGIKLGVKKRREVILFIVGRSESVWKHKEGSKSYNKETGKKGKRWLNKEKKGETRKHTIKQGRRHS